MNVFDATWLATSVVACAPLLLAAAGELISERAGVLNLGLEAYILGGSFFAYWTEYASGSLWLGLLGGVAAGLLFAAVMGVASIQFGADQIVIGIGLVVLVTGITSYIFDVQFAGGATVSFDPMGKTRIPLLSDIPYVGAPFFDQNVLVYLSYAAVPIVAFMLYRTKWGLAVRASGEAPTAAEANGIKVRLVRWQALMAAGAAGGLAGGYLSVCQLGFFVHGMSSGRGYLVLAAIFFGRWRAKGALIGCVLFGATQSLQLRLQGFGAVPREVWLAVAMAIVGHLLYLVLARRVSWTATLVVEGVLGALAVLPVITTPSVTLPSELWLGLPYALSLIVLALSVGTARMPSGLTLSPRAH